MRIYYYLVLMCFLFLASGCASLIQQPTANDDAARDSTAIDKVTNIEKSTDTRGDTGWWQVGFHRAIKQDEDPMWYLDAFIAYEVIKPILEQQNFTLWRFHRRAANDAAGHKFSFIFFSTRNTGEQIYQRIRENAMVKELLQENIVERLSFVDINGNVRSNVEDTSDKNWSIELQKAWPAFIMGVSQTWLYLIDEYAQQIPVDDTESLVSMLDRFDLINNKINTVWEMEGNHAFLHHLNALFGYQELYIIERRKTRF
ncbi:hypothetical protein [Kaarinaea lacus]